MIMVRNRREKETGRRMPYSSSETIRKLNLKNKKYQCLIKKHKRDLKEGKGSMTGEDLMRIWKETFQLFMEIQRERFKYLKHASDEMLKEQLRNETGNA